MSVAFCLQERKFVLIGNPLQITYVIAIKGIDDFFVGDPVYVGIVTASAIYGIGDPDKGIFSGGGDRQMGYLFTVEHIVNILASLRGQRETERELFVGLVGFKISIQYIASLSGRFYDNRVFSWNPIAVNDFFYGFIIRRTGFFYSIDIDFGLTE